jgi:hypothetical protein
MCTPHDKLKLMILRSYSAQCTIVSLLLSFTIAQGN